MGRKSLTGGTLDHGAVSGAELAAHRGVLIGVQLVVLLLALALLLLLLLLLAPLLLLFAFAFAVLRHGFALASSIDGLRLGN